MSEKDKEKNVFPLLEAIILPIARPPKSPKSPVSQQDTSGTKDKEKINEDKND